MLCPRVTININSPITDALELCPGIPSAKLGSEGRSEGRPPASPGPILPLRAGLRPVVKQNCFPYQLCASAGGAIQDR